MTTPYSEHIDTPFGMLEVLASNEAVTHISFVTQPSATRPNRITGLAIEQLQQYFAGQRQVFDLPLAAEGTGFQQTVWQALTGIEFGQTCSYQDIARHIHKPAAVRAVGAANGKNPIAIVVPCHRVIGKNGSLTGYAGGLNRKQGLLELEQRFAGKIQTPCR